MLLDPKWNEKLKLAKKTEVKAFLDLDTPSLEGLAYALRHPEIWPVGFEWAFDDCSQCAMGLAHRLWTKQVPQYFYAEDMSASFDISEFYASKIFGGDWTDNKSFDEITPVMVARQIEKLLKSRKNRSKTKGK